jgi:hypothetical protein
MHDLQFTSCLYIRVNAHREAIQIVTASILDYISTTRPKLIVIIIAAWRLLFALNTSFRKWMYEKVTFNIEPCCLLTLIKISHLRCGVDFGL